MTLKDLQPGESGIISAVGGEGALRQHFLDMGVIPGAEVTIVKYAPLGDPVELKIHGYELTLRIDDAAKIEMENRKPASAKGKKHSKQKETEHPGLGEEGKYHPKGSGNPLPSGTMSTKLSISVFMPLT